MTISPVSTSRRRRANMRAGSGPAGRSLDRWAWGTAGVVGFVIMWALVDATFTGAIANVKRLAGPGEVAATVVDYAQGDLLTDLWASFQVFGGGWAIGAATAILVGLLMGRVRVVRWALLPIVEAIRPVSSIVWLPLSIVWFGFGYTGKTFVVGLAVFLVVVVYTLDGSTRIPPDVERTADMLGMGPLRRFYRVVIPATLGETMIGLRVALMAGWGTVIVAELVAANSGLGAHLIRSQQRFDIAAVIATMVCFGASGFILDWVFSVAERLLIPWRQVRST